MTDATDGGVIGAGRVAVVTGAASESDALAEKFAARAPRSWWRTSAQ
jgi:hypothetical protein